MKFKIVEVEYLILIIKKLFLRVGRLVYVGFLNTIDNTQNKFKMYMLCQKDSNKK